jgi:hypothetical protein
VTTHPDALDRTATAWTALPKGIDDVRPAEVAAPRRMMVSREQIDGVRAAIGWVLDEIQAPVSIADICPDPLVFALENGLPRLTTGGRFIDGGSQWRDLAPIEPGPLFAVSAIAEVEQRRQADGRRLIRVTYLTHFTDEHGVLVGTATGISLHVGGAQ